MMPACASPKFTGIIQDTGTIGNIGLYASDRDTVESSSRGKRFLSALQRAAALFNRHSWKPSTVQTVVQYARSMLQLISSSW